MDGGFYMKRIELPEDSDEGVEKYQFEGKGRLILETVHGQIIIDIRGNDVNAFVIDYYGDGNRTDFLLIPKKED